MYPASMENDPNYVRSNLLLGRTQSIVLIVDVQERLLPLIPERNRLLWNLKRLTDGARALGVPVLATEQYPEKLGPTVGGLLSDAGAAPGNVPSKLSFSCCGSSEFRQQLKDHARRQVLVVGIESHVCVLQTVFDLLAECYDVHLAVDAIGARFESDTHTALRRMEINGVNLTTVESALFEWCEVAGTPEFKQISQIVKRSPNDST